MLRATWSSLAAVVALNTLAAVTGCRDGPTSAVPASEPEQSVYAIPCLADVSNLGLRCGAATTDPQAGASLAGGEIIVGEQGVYVLLESSNVSYDGSQVFQADVTLQNLIGQKLGTRDGTTLATEGIRIFFHTGPDVTSGSGSVVVSNADGTADFTGSNQPYHQYDEILAPDQVSQAKTWTWDVEPSVMTFQFTVYVWAPIQYENGWVDVSPTDPEVGIGLTEMLSAVVRNRLGQEVNGRTVTWSSSDPSIADVDPSTGELSGVAEGTCTVCASSSGPEADGCVTVTVKPVVYVRTLADPENPAVGATSGITLELDVTQISEPLISMVGDVTWDASLLDYLDDASGSIWDLLVANEDPPGTLAFSAASALGVSGDVLSALTFTVEALAQNCTDLMPTLTELAAIDPVTFETIDLLQRAIIITEPVNVCVVAP
ncbi:MAG: Ig-like domain-containing protein [Gemmatimonadales bacterium]